MIIYSISCFGWVYFMHCKLIFCSVAVGYLLVHGGCLSKPKYLIAGSGKKRIKLPGQATMIKVFTIQQRNKQNMNFEKSMKSGRSKQRIVTSLTE